MHEIIAAIVAGLFTLAAVWLSHALGTKSNPNKHNYSSRNEF